jgi:hypothetical protein
MGLSVFFLLIYSSFAAPLSKRGLLARGKKLYENIDYELHIGRNRDL